MKLKCIIVDDEPLALDILEEYIRRTPATELAGRFTSGSDALSFMERERVDVAFLDIQMPGTGGLEVAEKIGEGGVRVVFTTAFPQYALEGFKAWALDYLLKPINFDEFSRAVGRAMEWFSRAAAEASQAPQTLIVKSDYKQFVIPLAAIIYIEGIRDYIRIHTAGENGGPSGSVQTLMALKTVEGMLPAGGFARVHRSYIVSLDRVKRLERAHVILDGAGEPIPISDTYKDGFLSALAARAL
ncbi:MAG: LytTR family DNA-binding domain-containing protein [Alistipes sp.]|jgi:DNA-binding LytR/AlgR family response regulator|nr:LytTR family DNA-binding domain-containing protein [Alistipes sp.]